VAIDIFRTWVENPFISDHAPILLQLDLPPVFKAIPFKFNPLWSLDNGFYSIVHNLWTDPKYLRESDKKKCLVWKLKDLKKRTKVWQKETRTLKNARLRGLEQEISFRLQNLTEGTCQNMVNLSLKDLE